jgi:hypothetical protein
MAKTTKIVSSTQDHLDIEDVRDDMLILKDGRVAIILETSAVNFSLLSEVEQDAKINAFAGLLNSINYNLQIVVHTENVDVSKYIVTLEKYLNAQTSEKIKFQIQNYIEFIKNLIKKNEVLDKRFYVVIPYVPFGVKRTSPLRQIFGKPDHIVNIASLMENAKLDLYPKKDGIVKLLMRMGIKTRQLRTEEVIKLFFKLYNTDSGVLPKARFAEEEYTAGIVSSHDDFSGSSNDLDDLIGTTPEAKPQSTNMPFNGSNNS